MKKWLWILATLVSCTSEVEIRVQNTSKLDYTDVRVADQPYGDIAAGTTSKYLPVTLSSRYAVIKLRADGKYITGQTLNFGSDRFTYRMGIKDFDAGHLSIEVMKD